MMILAICIGALFVISLILELVLIAVSEKNNRR